MTVYPGFNLAFDDVNELFFVLFGVWPGRATAGREALNVDSYANQACFLAQAPNRTHGLGALRIDVRVLRNFVGRANECGTLIHWSSSLGRARGLPYAA